jgi:hypothetical protein
MSAVSLCLYGEDRNNFTFLYKSQVIFKHVQILVHSNKEFYPNWTRAYKIKLCDELIKQIVSLTCSNLHLVPWIRICGSIRPFFLMLSGSGGELGIVTTSLSTSIY